MTFFSYLNDEVSLYLYQFFPLSSLDLIYPPIESLNIEWRVGVRAPCSYMCYVVLRLSFFVNGWLCLNFFANPIHKSFVPSHGIGREIGKIAERSMAKTERNFQIRWIAGENATRSFEIVEQIAFPILKFAFLGGWTGLQFWSMVFLCRDFFWNWKQMLRGIQFFSSSRF